MSYDTIAIVKIFGVAEYILGRNDVCEVKVDALKHNQNKLP